jgi:PAS domain-containing protein
MNAFRGSRPALRLVEGAGSQAAVEWAWFCGHCAAPAPKDEAPAPTARVCRSCGLGLLLETRREIVPSERDAFLVIDSALLVQAMSRRAQTLLALTEEQAVNRPVAELLVPADAEAQASTGFASAIADAARGAEQPVSAIVRPWNTFGVRMRARIAPCGPPRAALVVLQGPRDRRLRAVD